MIGDSNRIPTTLSFFCYTLPDTKSTLDKLLADTSCESQVPCQGTESRVCKTGMDNTKCAICS